MRELTNALRHESLLRFECSFADHAQRETELDLIPLFRSSLWSEMGRTAIDSPHQNRLRQLAQKLQRRLKTPKLSPGEIGWSSIGSSGLIEATVEKQLDHMSALFLGQPAHVHFLGPDRQIDRVLSSVGSRTSLESIYSDFRSLAQFFSIYRPMVARSIRRVAPVIEDAVRLAGQQIAAHWLPSPNVLERAFRTGLSNFEYGLSLSAALLRSAPRLRVVFVTAWYGQALMGFIAGLRSRGVHVVEVQHGQQGPHQSMYVNLASNPEARYSPIPDEFWLWGQRTRDTIGSLPAGRRTRIVGMPILSDGHHFEDMLTEPISHADVTISLQPPHVDSKSPIPAGLVRQIKKSHARVRLRPHPNFLLPRKEAKQISRELGNHAFVESSRVPALFMLRHSSLHMSAFSSTVIESLALGVPSIVWSESASEILGGLMNSGLVSADPGFEKNLDYELERRTKITKRGQEALEYVVCRNPLLLAKEIERIQNMVVAT